MLFCSIQSLALQQTVLLHAIPTQNSGEPEILTQHSTQGIVHFAFEVANVDTTASVLRETGVTFACEPTSLPELSVRYFHIYDCDGNLLEFGQRI